VIGWNRFGDEIYFVIARPNTSPLQVPVWMTDPSAAEMKLREAPRFDVAALRDLRRLLDATRPPSDARSSTYRKDDDEKSSSIAEDVIRTANKNGRDEVAAERSDGAGQATTAGPAHRPYRRPKSVGGGSKPEGMR